MTRSDYRTMDETSLGGEKENVWKQELRYWDLFFRGDSGCLEMIADSFLGWPHNSGGPLPKSGIGKSLERNRARKVKPLLEPLGISIENNVAVVHLIRKLPSGADDESGQSSRVRVLHTWLKHRGKWLLLGGMGYPE